MAALDVDLDSGPESRSCSRTPQTYAYYSYYFLGPRAPTEGVDSPSYTFTLCSLKASRSGIFVPWSQRHEYPHNGLDWTRTYWIGLIAVWGIRAQG